MRRLSLGAIVFLTVTVSLAFCPAAVGAKDDNYVNPAVNGPGQPAYWIDLGGLYATYGNYTAAIDAYNKALELNASLSSAHYNIALAWAELEDYSKALDRINKAISMDAEQDRYFYARARIYLLVGLTAKAMDDFEKAAEMGNPDAIAYLKQ